MSDKYNYRKEYDFNKMLVSEYFKCGTVDEVMRRHRFNLPISYAGYQRVLDKWGVVKAAGPNSKFTESLEFFTHLAEDNIPFEALYKKMPPSFQTSTATLYRILGYIKEGLTRRVGTALVITPFSTPKKILLGYDVSTPRIELGKSYGSISLPMGFSHKRDGRRNAILRVLQQEVFTQFCINKEMPLDIIPKDPQPFIYLDIADVRVAAYHIQMPQTLSALKNYSSYKLRDYRFVEVDSIIEKRNSGVHTYRAGIVDITRGYAKYLRLLERKLAVNPFQDRSLLNRELAEITVDVEV
jgi:hypothetical protein